MKDEVTKMEGKFRKTGIDIIGDIPWGTHICQFYRTRKDLTEILIPYLQAGLQNNELCMWITSRPLKMEKAREALAKAVKDLDDYIQNGQIEILDASQWYTAEGQFEPEKVLQGWAQKENQALERGFDGLRLTGNIFWLEKRDWSDFIAYETEVNNTIDQHRIIAVCSYSLDKCGVSEVLEALSVHQFALIKRRDKWEAIENAERRRTAEELRKSRERYRRLYQEAPVGYHEIDREGKIVRVNETEANLLGYTVQEMVGKSVWEFMPPDQQELAIRAINKKIEKRRLLAPEGFERKYVCKDGREIDVYIVDRLVIDKQGEVTSIRSTVQDITQRKQAEEALRESEERLTNFMASATDGFIFYDSALNLVEINEAGLGIFPVETKKEDLIGKNILDISPGLKETGRYDRYREVTKTGKSFFIDDLVPHPKFGDRHLAIRAFKVGEGLGIIFTDITDRKQAEEKLKETLAELERSNLELEQFAYAASHDLQEPLRMVSSYVQLLAKRYRGKLDSDADDFIEYAVDGASRMQRMINDLLVYSRVGRLEEPLKPVDCQAVLEQVLANLEGAIEESGAVVTHDTLPEVSANASQLAQLFQNLIGNAIRFRSDEPLQVHIGVGRKDDQWLFWVRDNGIGIDPQYAERIFTMFQRLHPRSEYPGTGIGLAICKKIVEGHGGRIWVDSHPGKGATFYFTIPTKAGDNDD